MLKKKHLKIKIPIPENASVFAEKGDLAKDLLLYEYDELEVLEEVKINSAKAKFRVKDGQFVNKGDVIFTEGVLGHKAMIADFNGIIEIKEGLCRILGQKKHFEKRIDLNAKVLRIVPRKYIEITSKFNYLDAVYFTNSRNKITPLIVVKNMAEIEQHELGFWEGQTLFVNNNIYLDDLARIKAYGVKKLIVNGVYIDDTRAFRREVSKFESFCLLAGYGELVTKVVQTEHFTQNVFWSKKQVYFGDELEVNTQMVYEHPFWGVSGNITIKDALTGEVEKNGEVLDFYLKNTNS